MRYDIETNHRPGWGRLSGTQRLMLHGVGILVAVTFLAGVVGGWSERAIASDDAAAEAGTASVFSQWHFLRQSLDSATGELELAHLKLERAEAILAYSGRYHIPADLAMEIYDAAVATGLDPELGFRLARVESNFNPRARSTADAFGLVQVRLQTARYYKPDVTQEDLYDPATNLRIGFSYLRHLIERYGDLRLALLAYNRGPTRVANLMDEGLDPRNGYATSVMKGYDVGM